MRQIYSTSSITCQMNSNVRVYGRTDSRGKEPESLMMEAQHSSTTNHTPPYHHLCTYRHTHTHTHTQPKLYKDISKISLRCGICHTCSHSTGQSQSHDQTKSNGNLWLTWQKGKGSVIDNYVIQCVTDMKNNVLKL